MILITFILDIEKNYYIIAQCKRAFEQKAGL